MVVNPLRLRSATLNELSYSLSLFFTGTTREGGRIIEEQTERVISNNNEAVTALRELKSLTIELKRQLLSGDIPGFGNTLDRAWMSKRRLAPGITTERLDELYGIATRNGAWGGKLLGAGGGGYLLVASPYRTRQRIIAELGRAGAQYVPFSFEWDGLVPWRASTG